MYFGMQSVFSLCILCYVAFWRCVFCVVSRFHSAFVCYVANSNSLKNDAKQYLQMSRYTKRMNVKTFKTRTIQIKIVGSNLSVEIIN